MGIKGLKKLKKQLRDLPSEVEKGGVRGAKTGLEAVEKNARIQLARENTNYLYRVSKSLDVEVDGETTLRLTAGGPEAPHAPFVEFGTGAYFRNRWGVAIPRFDAPTFSEKLVSEIETWVETKPVIPKYYSREQLPKAIAMSISDLGTSANPFLRTSWTTTKPEVKRQIRVGIKRQLRRL